MRILARDGYKKGAKNNMDSKSCNHSIEKEKICRRIMDVSVQFLLVFVITFAVTMISFAGFGKRTVKAAETENTYSTNVSIATDQSTYYCVRTSL